MAETARTTLLLTCLCLSWLSVSCYQNGAGHSSCQTLQPPANHGTPGFGSFFVLEPNSTTYSNDGGINVKIRGGDFTGLMLQARRINNPQNWRPVGRFAFPSSDSQLQVMTCVGDFDTVTQLASDFYTLPSAVVTWIAPGDSAGNIEFVATFISGANYYTNIKSGTITYKAPPSPTAMPTAVPTQTPKPPFRRNSAHTVHSAYQYTLVVMAVAHAICILRR